MTEIIQLPSGQNGNQGREGVNILPVGNNGNGIFGGNGPTSIGDLFAFAIIASMFPNLFGNGIGNNRGGGGGCQNVDSALALQAVTSEGAANRAAVQNLATSMNQNYATILPAVQSVQNMLYSIASANGMGFLQVINALQSGNANLASQLEKCCCDNRLLTTQQGYESQIRTVEQTGQINGNITAQSQRQIDAIADLKTTLIKEFCDARERDMQSVIDRQADEIGQLRTKDNITAQTGQILNYVTSLISPLQATVNEIQSKMPNTVPVQYPNLQVVNNTPNANYPGVYYNNGYCCRGGF